MNCTTKVLGYWSLISLAFHIASLIIGIIVMVRKVPEANCGVASVTKSDQDNVNSVLVIIGIPTVLGACSGFISGGVGFVAGKKSNRNLIMVCICLFTVTCIAFWIATVISMLYGATLGRMCDLYECSASNRPTPHCSKYYRFAPPICRNPKTCCYCKGVRELYSMCKESHEWVCNLATTKAASLLFCFICGLFSTIGAGCSCGAACCCQESWGMAERPSQANQAMPVGMVIGQPVQAPMEGSQQK